MACDELRPKWDFALSETGFRKMRGGSITQIRHNWRFTGEDTAEDWIEFSTKDGDFFRAPDDWHKLFKFEPNHRELVVTNYEGEKAIKRLEEIDAWERKNQRDRSEYERLRKKFGGAL
jgi:hypothetical protein